MIQINGDLSCFEAKLNGNETGSGQSEPQHPALDLDAVRGRLQHLLKGMTYQQIAQLTRIHPETVRRYLTDGRCSVDFLHAMCVVFAADANWLLTGVGFPTQAARTESLLREVSNEALLHAAADRLCSMISTVQSCPDGAPREPEFEDENESSAAGAFCGRTEAQPAQLTH